MAGVLVVSLLFVPAALATTPSTDINSTGPLTDIWIGNELSCQVAYSGDTADEFYGPQGAPADCGTFVSTGGTLYGPDFANHGGSATSTGDTPFTPVSQSAVTGAGTSASPYSVTTVVTAGTTGLTVTEVDSYVVGSESYRTDVTVANSGTSTVSALLYHAGDCYLQGSDQGYGFIDPATNAPACTANANNSPAGRIEEFQPITPGIHYVETGYSSVWSDVGAQADLPNTCDCTTFEDNGAGINWDVSVPGGGQVTYSFLTGFSPTGALALSTAKTATSSTATAGTQDGYTITISNPNASAVSLGSITDTLPAGFTYKTGSTTGATTSDPGVSGQTLTWTGPISVPAASGSTPGTVSLSFNVTVSSANGTYYNNAGGTATGYTVAPTGNTAPVTVSGGSGDAADTGNGQNVSATEGQALSNASVATFTDPTADSSASDYTASINWGDGSTSTGTVGGTGGSYTVTGSHTYAEQGSYGITVTITDGDTTTNITTTTSTATVGEQPLTPTAAAVSATEGHSFSGTVATFTDGDTAATAGEYSATIDWGDGTSTSGGTITGSAGSFTVSGTHTYAEEGTHTLHVTVQEIDNATATAAASTATATVGDAALSGTGAGTLSSGASFSGGVATFTDANTGAPASDFTASINWGDSQTSAGVVSGSAGSYSVSGTHTYAAGATYTVHISISDDGGASTSATTSIVVTITGNQVPVCTAVTANPSRLWPPNHKFRLVTLSGATDPDGDALTYQITGVQQDEPVVGPDSTAPDAELGATGNTVKVRAERRGSGHGRLYFIAFTVTDGHGGSCSGTVVVAVPHDHHQAHVPDTGQRFNSLATPVLHVHHHHHHHHH